MKSILVFASIQIMIYIFSMSNTLTISIIVLGSALALFAGVYLSALIKDKRHRRKAVNAVLELR
ncbi:MAG TPA: hypothetical protein DHV28_00480 [Ignavibacteriales bacterium]|nr:hypothetical protein [Ignavibacteriales bacterium]